jgi:hypothetical protein
MDSITVEKPTNYDASCQNKKNQNCPGNSKGPDKKLNFNDSNILHNKEDSKTNEGKNKNESEIHVASCLN